MAVWSSVGNCWKDVLFCLQWGSFSHKTRFQTTWRLFPHCCFLALHFTLCSKYDYCIQEVRKKGKHFQTPFSWRHTVKWWCLTPTFWVAQFWANQSSNSASCWNWLIILEHRQKTSTSLMTLIGPTTFWLIMKGIWLCSSRCHKSESKIVGTFTCSILLNEI